MADNKDVIICPACGCEMEKVFIPDLGINLDVCSKGCGGIWFDNREFKKFDEPHEDITPVVEVLEGKEFKNVDDDKLRICPVCGMNMVKNNASAKHEVTIDECYGCGGKFLDFKELDKIRSQYNTEEERAADAIRELYSLAGVELTAFTEEYEKRMENPSMLTRLIKLKYK